MWFGETYISYPERKIQKHFGQLVELEKYFGQLVELKEYLQDLEKHFYFDVQKFLIIRKTQLHRECRPNL